MRAVKRIGFFPRSNPDKCGWFRNAISQRKVLRGCSIVEPGYLVVLPEINANNVKYFTLLAHNM